MQPGARTTNGSGPLGIQVRYDRTQLETGQTVNVEAVVSNRGRETARMLLADLGTPPGFSVDPAGLDKLRDEGKIDRYTLTARGVIVYIGSPAPNADLRLRYAITARMPLKAVAAPTSVYAYYQPQQSASAAAMRFEVKEAGNR